MALNHRQQLFVDAYLIDPNATAAARSAGYSEKTADSQGARLLKNVRVAKELERLQRARARRAHVRADLVLQEVKRLALVDVGELFDEAGRMVPLKKLPARVRRAIASFEVVQMAGAGGELLDDGAPRPAAVVVTKVKLLDKFKSLELLAKHLGLVKEKHEHKLSDSFEALVLASLKPPEAQ